MRTAVRRVARRAASFTLAAAFSAAAIGAPALAQEAAPAGPALVSAGEPVLLREGPGYDAVALATLGQGDGVDVVGPAVAGPDGAAWLPVAAAGRSGYLPAGAVAAGAAPAPAAEPAAETAAAPDAPPATEAQPILEAPSAPAADPAAAAPPSAVAPVPAGAAATTSDVNLRAGPSGDAAVLLALPPGTAVSVDGAPVDGYAPVTAGGASGWVAAEFLAAAPPAAGVLAPAEPAPPAPGAAAQPPLPEPVTSEAATSEPTAGEAPPAAAAPAAEANDTGIAWPFAGGSWQVIQGYNNGTHTNRSGFAQYKYALDWARVDGDTAGQPVYAPVSGTIEWTDRGSGGLLMNAGNGYGVALFHVTLDGSVARGGAVERGQRIGVVSGLGGDGYASTPHVDMTLWELSGGGHTATPFSGPNDIAGQEFPDTGGGNQYMGFEVTP